jgi:MFS family permease
MTAARRRGLHLILLTLAASAAAYARTAMSPLQETMRSALSLSDNQLALLQGPALAVASVVAALPLGLAIDRYSRVRLLFVLALLGLAGSLMTALAADINELFASRCLIGLTSTATSMTASSLLADLFKPAQRGRAIMVMAVGQVAGISAAFAFGGALLAASGSNPEGWRHAMLWLSAPLAAVVIVTLAMREPVRSGRAVESPSVRSTFFELWQYRRVVATLLIGAVMVAIADVAALIWAAPALSRNFALTPDRVGAIMATVLLVTGIAGPIAGGLSADWCQRTGGPRRTILMLSGLTFLSVPAGLFATVPGIVAASLLLAVLITIANMTGAIFTAVATVVIPNELLGLCFGVFAIAGAVFGTALAPLLVSLLSNSIGGPAKIGEALAIVCVTTSLIGAVTFALGSRHFPRQA